MTLAADQTQRSASQHLGAKPGTLGNYSNGFAIGTPLPV